MSRKTTEKLIRAYFTAVSIRDVDGLLALLDERVIHDPAHGAREQGKAAFRSHLERTQRCFQESVHDLAVMIDGDGRRAAAEFTLLGKYVESADGLPPACGQDYGVAGGAFFLVDERKIIRVTHYANRENWLQQLGIVA
jgi:steroid delta-isomerase-like uncharacterized protein